MMLSRRYPALNLEFMASLLRAPTARYLGCACSSFLDIACLVKTSGGSLSSMSASSLAMFKYTFGVLKTVQGRGGFQVLAEHEW